jgi:hypothetical protein
MNGGYQSRIADTPILKSKGHSCPGLRQKFVALRNDIFWNSVEFGWIKLANEFILDVVAFIDELLNNRIPNIKP